MNVIDDKRRSVRSGGPYSYISSDIDSFGIARGPIVCFVLYIVLFLTHRSPVYGDAGIGCWKWGVNLDFVI